MVCVSWNLGLYLRNPSGEELTEIVWKQNNSLHYDLARPTLNWFWREVSADENLHFHFQSLFWCENIIRARSSSHVSLGCSRRGGFSFLLFCGSTVLFLSFDFRTKFNLLFSWTTTNPPAGVVESKGKPRHFGNARNLQDGWVNWSCKVSLRWKIRKSKRWKSSFVLFCFTFPISIVPIYYQIHPPPAPFFFFYPT